MNPPQAAILAVGQTAGSKRDRLEVRPIASLTITADHHVVDRAIVARFLADLKMAIERTDLLL
jgi:pyruvate dehydrogenase E2 component (dihydrolipoamide acetyltransferase)